MAEPVVKHLPAGPADKPVEQWSIAELLVDAARLGLMRLREFVSRSIDETAEGGTYGRLENNG